MKRQKHWRAEKSAKLHLSSRLTQQLKDQETLSAADQEWPSEQEANHATKWLHPLRVGLVLLVFVAISIAVWILPLRPKHSEFEQRELAAFPAFRWETLASGEYFDDISLWFSDTFPCRETWVNLSAAINRCFGLRSETIHGNIQQGDAIPVLPSTTTSTTTSTTVTTTTTSTTASSSTTGTKPSSTKTTTTTATKKPSSTKKTTTTTNKNIQNQNQDLGGLLVRGDTAYEYYNFVRSTADDYTAAVNRAAAKWKGSASVYALLAPTSIDVMLPDNKKPAASSDQGKAIAYLYGSMSANVKTVDARAALLKHNTEYLYFHTDHHWTARGAYYAYAEFMKAQGKQPTPLSAYKEHAFDGFLGSFYASTKDTDLKLGADTVYAYEPQGNIEMFYRASTGGSNVPYDVIADMTDWSPRYKYNTFIAGDQPYVEITNHDVKDKSSIVLIKESFGNAFAPFLVTQYHKVYVIDYRYYTGNLTSFIKKNKVGTVLFLNNMSATRNSYLVGALDDLIG
ncbi:MAG: hypothetical protein IJB26_04675 [Clostridia bacterium]|nr:hypothetical protein [Clostridia bacterium]MBQ4612821.1 hypothetical protein [Clostridia bacterium]